MPTFEPYFQKFREKLTIIELDRPKLNVETVWTDFAYSKYDLNALNGLQFRPFVVLKRQH